MQQTLNQYEKRLRLAGMQPSTIRSYSHNLKDFFLYTQTVHIDDFMIEDYLNLKLERGIDKQTYNQIMYSIRWYCLNLQKSSFPLHIRKIQPRRKIKDIPNKEKILEAIRQIEEITEKVIMLLFYDGWLRRSELQILKVKDINLDNREVFVRSGKGDKDRVITITKTTAAFISYYLKFRENQKNPYLLHAIGSDCRYVSKSYLWDVVNMAGRLAGYETWHPHLMRHSGATHTWLETGDLVSISDKLGHKDITTTMIYLNLTERNLVRRKTNAVSPLLSYKHGDNH